MSTNIRAAAHSDIDVELPFSEYRRRMYLRMDNPDSLRHRTWHVVCNRWLMMMLAIITAIASIVYVMALPTDVILAAVESVSKVFVVSTLVTLAASIIIMLVGPIVRSLGEWLTGG